ncbi:pSer/pThr/pTyr-binding forkhead associated (FHA) protein [Natranaerovirga pectinivora]|uniref:PSer/pThr/pTyr-binding forkhead associated (FHA) protein n=1 Tax=Natranaerovirga pectinivora TaxID=682400 RepID=A0A4R3MIT9_9FIRM|nr:DUF6382 domain-containing protein [Natranaerovirga pectinivora]TCT11645.1 pSer/pThr/pTyr-binding forkhead associated (FHA) protein [Natranaerovirga pectinivora]
MNAISQYKLSFDRDIHKNYMLFSGNINNFQEEDYQLKMLLNNSITNLLEFNLVCHNEDVKLHYDITSKQSLRDILTKRELTSKEIKKLLERIIDTVENGCNYLLDENNYLICPEYIYINISSFEPYFCYLPQAQIEENMMDKLKDLIEYLMNNASEKDSDAVLLIHRLYKKTKKDDFTFKDLKNILYQKNEKSEITIRDNNEEKVELREKVAESSIAKSKVVSRAPIKRERVKEDKEILKFSTKYKIIAVFIQVLMLLLMYLTVSRKVFVDSVTKELDVVNLVAFFVILIVIDLYMLTKIFNSKNKIVKIVQVEKEVPIPSSINYSCITLERQSMYDNKNLPSINDEPMHLPIVEKVKNEDEGTVLLSNNPQEEGTMLLNEEVNDRKASLSYSKGNFIEEININVFPFLIGKLKGQVDYVIDSDTISRLHAKIIYNNNSYYIIDINSRNGTFLNGMRLDSQKEYLLNNGDEIKFCNIKVTFNNI